MLHLLRDHDKYYESLLGGIFTVTDRIKMGFSSRLNAVIEPGVGVLYRQLFLQRTDVHLPFLIILMLGIFFPILAVIFSHTVTPENPYIYGAPPHEFYIFLFIFFIFICLCFIPFAHWLSQSKYILFQGNRAVVNGRQFGRKVYNINELKFIIINDWLKPDPVCNLWVELPDPTLPDKDRKIMIESTSGVKAMQGKLKSLLPLLCGDDSELMNARKLPYYEFNKKPVWFFVDLFEHIRIPLSRYLVSHMLFLAVHGTCRSIFKKERLILEAASKQGVIYDTKQ